MNLIGKWHQSNQGGAGFSKHSGAVAEAQPSVEQSVQPHWTN